MRGDFHSIRRLRYPIPDVINPPDSVCIEVLVPNNIGHIAAFWGQMFALTKWYAWEADNAHSGKALAEVWRGVYEAAQESECEHVLVRTNPFNSCELQVSYDGGVVWETRFNARPCAITAIRDTLGDGSDQPGSRTQPGAQPGGDNPAPGQCFTFDAAINANARWLIPLPVSQGWTIDINTWNGATNGGGIPTGLVWSCPNGKQFVLGACTNLDMPIDAGDPIPTAPHMRLIVQLPNGNYDVVNKDTLYTVPTGVAPGNAYLMCNDSDLRDNSGSYFVNLTVCAPSCASVITYPFGSGPSVFPDVGETFTFTSAYQPAVNPEQTMWIYWNAPMRLKLVDIGAWSHYDMPPNFHTYGYAPSNVAGSNLGAYTFFDAPSVVSLPVGDEITMNGFYTRAAPDNPFTLTFQVIRCGY